METVLIFKSSNGTFEIVECWLTKYGNYTHNEGVRMDGFKCKEDAVNYCHEFNYKIITQ